MSDFEREQMLAEAWRKACAERDAALAEVKRLREYAAQHNGNALDAVIAQRDALADRVAQLQTTCGNLTDRVDELEKVIEDVASALSERVENATWWIGFLSGRAAQLRAALAKGGAK